VITRDYSFTYICQHKMYCS